MSTAPRLSPTDLATDRVEWRKSSHSDAQGQGNCVEIAETYATTHGVIAIRDSKNPTGQPLLVTTTAWHTFTTATAAYHFDTP